MKFLVRVLVIGGLNEKGYSFVETLGKDVWLVIFDALRDADAGKRLMSLLIKRKFKFYEGDEGDKEIIEKIKKEERINKIYDFSS